MTRYRTKKHNEYSNYGERGYETHCLEGVVDLEVFVKCFFSLNSQSQHGFHFVCSNVVSFPESQTARPDLAAKCR